MWAKNSGKGLTKNENRCTLLLPTEPSATEKGRRGYGQKAFKSEARKREILAAAAKLITEKGYSHVTMEDVVEATGLSKGGLYHYYKSVDDILYDLMVEGIRYRNDIIKGAMATNDGPIDPKFVAESIVDKMLDDNPYMPVYVQFLLAKRRNGKLEKLFLKLKEQTLEELNTFLFIEGGVQMNEDMLDLLTDFINTVILGSELLDARENFKKHRQLLLAAAQNILKSTV